MRLGSPKAMRWDGDLDPPPEDVDEQEGMTRSAIVKWCDDDAEDNDKWGDAYCVCLREPSKDLPGQWVFYGWASS